jgi:hypothetical protein
MSINSEILSAQCFTGQCVLGYSDFEHFFKKMDVRPKVLDEKKNLKEF